MSLIDKIFDPRDNRDFQEDMARISYKCPLCGVSFHKVARVINTDLCIYCYNIDKFNRL